MVRNATKKGSRPSQCGGAFDSRLANRQIEQRPGGKREHQPIVIFVRVMHGSQKCYRGLAPAIKRCSVELCESNPGDDAADNAPRLQLIQRPAHFRQRSGLDRNRIYFFLLRQGDDSFQFFDAAEMRALNCDRA